MNKVRINDLARELEVKSRPILDALEALGVTGKTHSSSIDEDQAEKVRGYFNGGSRTSTVSKPVVAAAPKFDLSKVSKPGDALKAILERKQADATARSMPPPRPPAVVATPAQVPVSATPVVPKVSVVAPVVVAAAPPAVPGQVAPRRIMPQVVRPPANIIVPTPPPAIASKPPVGPVIAKPSAVPAAPVAVAASAPAVVVPPRSLPSLRRLRVLRLLWWLRPLLPRLRLLR